MIGVSGFEHLPTASAEANADPALIVKNRFAVEYCESAADAAHFEIVPVALDDSAPLAGLARPSPAEWQYTQKS